VDEAVKVSRAFFYLLSHSIIHFDVEDVCDEVQRILVILHLCIQACQVEAIRQVVFIDFAKVLIAA